MPGMNQFLVLIMVAALEHEVWSAVCPAPAFEQRTQQIQGISGIELADLDRDGILDLVTRNLWLRGRGDGTFAQPDPVVPGQLAGRDPLVVDVNGDARPDLLVGIGSSVDPCAGGTAGQASLSTATGEFVLGPVFWGMGLALPVDWDQDGNVDLLGGGGDGGIVGAPCAIVARHGDGEGRFHRVSTLAPVSLESGVRRFCLLDFDRDGDLDFAYTSRGADGLRKLRILARREDGSLEENAVHEQDFSVSSAEPLLAADFDNDGFADLITVSSGGMIVFLARPNGTLHVVTTALPASGVTSVNDYRISDVNVDGALDVALIMQRQGPTAPERSFVVLCGDGAGGFSTCATVPLASQAVSDLAVGDLDNDGRTDVVFGRAPGEITVLRNACPDSGRLVGTIPTVVSDGGAHGAFFKTRLTMSNTSAEPVSGRLVFHPRWRPGRDDDPVYEFSLSPQEARQYRDLAAEMGTWGAGSLDVFLRTGSSVTATAEVFNSTQGDFADGAEEPLVASRDVLTVGSGGDVAVPGDLVSNRFAIGIRTFAEPVDVAATVRDSAGGVLGSVQRSIGAMRLVQQSATEYLGGIPLRGGETIAFSVIRGRAIIYATVADNATSEPRIQVLRRPDFDDHPDAGALPNRMDPAIRE